MKMKQLARMHNFETEQNNDESSLVDNDNNVIQSMSAFFGVYLKGRCIHKLLVIFVTALQSSRRVVELSRLPVVRVTSCRGDKLSGWRVSGWRVVGVTSCRDDKLSECGFRGDELSEWRVVAVLSCPSSENVCLCVYLLPNLSLCLGSNLSCI